MKKLIAASALALLILLRAVPAPGASWQDGEETVPVLEGSSSLGVSDHPAAADPEGRIYLAFQNSAGTTVNRVALVVRNPDGTWGSPVTVSAAGRAARNPSAVRDAEGRIHVLWEDFTDGEGDIAHRYLSPGGTWSDPELVDPAPGVSRHCAAAVDGLGRLHAVWVDGRSGRPQILHAIWSPDSGWSGTDLLSVNGDAPDEPTMAVDGMGNIHVAWQDRTGSSREDQGSDLLYVRLDIGGEDPEPVRLVSRLSLAQRPFLTATEEGVLHLVWLDSRDAAGGLYSEVYYKRFLPGIGWGHDKRFTWNNFDHARPVVTAVGATVNIGYEDFRYGNPEIYYRQITPEFGWDPKPTRLTHDIYASQSPALVALPEGRLILLWADSRLNGAFGIFAMTGEVNGLD